MMLLTKTGMANIRRPARKPCQGRPWYGIITRNTVTVRYQSLDFGEKTIAFYDVLLVRLFLVLGNIWVSEGNENEFPLHLGRKSLADQPLLFFAEVKVRVRIH